MVAVALARLAVSRPCFGAAASSCIYLPSGTVWLRTLAPAAPGSGLLAGECPMTYNVAEKRLGKSSRGVRMMGGGPRTFPGGVTKWQWKRMQEKKERQLEKARLMRERQAFEERRRQELMAGAPVIEKPWEKPLPRNPLTPSTAALDPRVRALADRFRKAGGEDLWSVDDGPEVATTAPGVATTRFLANRSFSSMQMIQEVAKGRPGSSPRRASMSGTDSVSLEKHASNSPSRRYKDAGASSLELEGGPRIGTVRNVSPNGSDSCALTHELDNSRASRVFSSTSGAALAGEGVDARNSRPFRVPGSDAGKHLSTEIKQVLPFRRGPAQDSLKEVGPGKRNTESLHPNVGTVSIGETSQQLKKVRSEFSEDGKQGQEVNMSEEGLSHLSESRFDQFQISRLSVRALHEVMGYERMTQVQEATFPVILEGKDVLAKAKTGTGKTIAFLLPSIEAILKAGKETRISTLRSPINVLIICPTRELANQAAAEAKALMAFHKGMDAQVVIGGTNMNTESNNLLRKPCQILVGTPGRLLDHMQTSREIRQQLSQLKVLVLDEADRLLDMGFQKALDAILEMLPAARQTLLFSATVPNEVHKVSRKALKKDHVMIDTVGEDAEETHLKVQQKYIISPLESQLPVVFSLLEEHMKEDPNYKVLVFCTTARLTALLAELSTKLGLNTLEIHSRKSQACRTRVSDEFRKSEGGVIMFTSDVSARGVDYPDVTLVIQLGIPSGREDYIHRLGRTGRAGKDGRGILLLTPWEKTFLQCLDNIPILESIVPERISSIEAKVRRALTEVNIESKERAYAAWLGYYNSAKMLSLNKTQLVQLANLFSSTLGLSEPPILLKKTIGMMGLKGVPGLRS